MQCGVNHMDGSSHGLKCRRNIGEAQGHAFGPRPAPFVDQPVGGLHEANAGLFRVGFRVHGQAPQGKVILGPIMQKILAGRKGSRPCHWDELVYSARPQTNSLPELFWLCLPRHRLWP